MQLKQVNQEFYVADQISQRDVAELANKGIKTIICNRPDGEGADQPNIIEIQEVASTHGIQVEYLPVVSGRVTDEQAEEFKSVYQSAQKPILAFCRTGTRSITLWGLSQVSGLSLDQMLLVSKTLGYDLQGLVPRILNQHPIQLNNVPKFSVVIVGGGAAGISVASSLLSREPNLDIAVIDPAEIHYYQPGWTMVGSGIFCT